MVNIENKKECVGCAACVQICPRSCIDFYQDKEGFSYPIVDLNICINCNLCEKVCPVLNGRSERKPKHTFAAKNSDEYIRKESSSGGIFTLLCEKVIDSGGVVFGAKFNDNWEVYHDYITELSAINEFRGSKYVQSRLMIRIKRRKKN